MAFSFIGDVKGIQKEQLNFVSKVLTELGYRNEDVKVESIGGDGQNFVANVKRFVVEKQGKIFKMVAKVAPSNEVLRKTMNVPVMFQNEHVMYTEVLPKFTEFEISAGFPESEMFRYAKCYGSSSKAPNEIILLEDLADSNFVVLDKLKSLTTDDIKLILKNFAILHALSYALSYQEPETFKALKRKLINTWVLMNKTEYYKHVFTKMENEIMYLIENVKHKEAFKGTLGILTDVAEETYNYDKESKHSIIQQGDAWTNNVLFRFVNEKPVACCMIDYQLSREGSPVGDIHYMIFNCTDHTTRSKHYQDWINYYYSELTKSLSKFGLKSESVYPRDQFDKDQKRYGKYSLGLAVLVGSVLIREAKEAAALKQSLEEDPNGDVDKDQLADLSGKSIERFRKRLTGLIDSFVELNLL